MSILGRFLNPLNNPQGFDPARSISNFSSKVVIVTGGNAGVGKESVLQFAKHHPKKLYLCARSQEKFDAAVADIRTSVPDARIQFLQLDLASLASVAAAAQKIIAENDRLDILMNNAGIMCAPHGVTAEGYEVHFGTNHMGHALLTRLLLPLLAKTSELPDADVRIVNVSSVGHSLASKGIPFDSLKNANESKHSLQLYGVSKLANILHAKQVAKLYPGILTTSAHPGRTETNLASDYKEAGSWTAKFFGLSDRLVRPLTAREGALCQLWSALWPRDEIENGGFFSPVGQPGGGSAKSNDMKLADDLWKWQEIEFKTLGYI